MKWYSTQKLVIFRSSLSRDIGPKRQIVTEMPSNMFYSDQDLCSKEGVCNFVYM